jgi:hypothetical protein
LTFTGEAQLWWHTQVMQLTNYESWEDMRAHQRMWLGRVGKQPYTQWDDVPLSEFFTAMRGLIRVQEDESAAIEKARSEANLR